jgi:3-dehydroquinate synthase
LKKVIISLLERNYTVFIGSGNLDLIIEEIERQKLYKNIFAVIDSNVYKFYFNKINELLQRAQYKTGYYILPAGEKYKANAELNKIYSSLIEKKFGRDTLILAVGGGVTGDLAGFAASTFMRGVHLVHVPTTILAAVDSSVGGKTGINFNARKNMIGTFYQPRFVLIDTDFFSTLSPAEKRSGFGEVIKYAFLSDRSFYEYIKENLQSAYSGIKEVIEKIIFVSVSIKGEVVSNDEKESGLRRILNFGHTFGHAIESDLKFKVKHGEAVLAGIAAALFLSNILGILDPSKLKEFLDFLAELKLSPKIAHFNNENIIHLMQSDKKIIGGKSKFVLLADIGKIIIDAEADNNQIAAALNKTKNFLQKKKK